MEKTTIQKTTAAGLCTGCGVCAGVCPREAIGWELSGGIYQPRLDPEKCVSCGLCARVCPGLGHAYAPAADGMQTVTGPYIACYSAWSRDAELRHVSASGGVVTTLVRRLLEQGRYDSVFCVDGYGCTDQLRTRRHTADTLLAEGSATPKSRYLPVSHQAAVEYLLAHRDERIIFIATSCALRGLTAVLEQRQLRRENYLLLGLFCDKIFNHNVLLYWQDRYCGGAPIRALHFKDKDSGGWPGDMKFFPASGGSFYRPLRERSNAKGYFLPERCLYCVDKLNVCADISLGDNYTPTASSPLGSNSVVLRTRRGADAWEAAKDALESVPVDICQIQRAQYLEGRMNNLYFGVLKGAQAGLELNTGVPIEQDALDFTDAWKRVLRRLRTGERYDRDKGPLEKQMRRDSRKPNPIHRFLSRGLGFLRRQLRRIHP